MDLKEKFLQNIKETTEGLTVSVNPSSLFKSLSDEYISEIESNPIANFKHKLQKTSNQIKKTKLEENEFSSFIGSIPLTEEILEKNLVINDFVEESTDIVEVESIELPEPIVKNDLITATTNTITKEELNKSFKEGIDLFNQPSSKLTDPNIKALQNKLKFLEDWVSKISMAGPGSGEVNFRWLDDIDRNSISGGKYLKYNEELDKFQFDNIYQENLVKVVSTISSNSYTIQDNDYYIGVGIQSSTEILLVDSINGREVIVKDETGNCSNNPITITGNIDNSNSAILMIDNGSLHFIYNNGSWRII